jgi:hypothetical protein
MAIDVKATMFGIALVVLLSITALPLPLSGEGSALLPSTTDRSLTNLSVEHVDDVTYVWQEINGFCHWAALSMVFQHAGAPLDLATLFAVSGIGFSASYIRDTGIATFYPGPWFRQIRPVGYVSELYGLNCTFFIDPNSGTGALTAPFLDFTGVPYAVINGQSEAFALLRASIDEGHPLSIWVDPYYLPPVDYDVVRDFNLTYDVSGAGHAIVVVGYNDTAQTVQIMDPGVGAFGDELYGYPSDGRWYYPMNYTDLTEAWSTLGYSTFLIKPDTGPIEDLEEQLATMVRNRLLGDPATYTSGLNDSLMLHFGTNAFRRLSKDLTPAGIIGYLTEFSGLPDEREQQINALARLGLFLEAGMVMQFLSYRSALQTLPNLLPSLDLTTFLAIGQQALPHMEILAPNRSLTSMGVSGYQSLLKDTFVGIINRFAESGNLLLAVTEYMGQLFEINWHLSAIATVWEAAGSHLSMLLGESPMPIWIPIAVGISIILSIALVAVYVFRKRSQVIA